MSSDWLGDDHMTSGHISTSKTNTAQHEPKMLTSCVCLVKTFSGSTFWVSTEDKRVYKIGIWRLDFSFLKMSGGDHLKIRDFPCLFKTWLLQTFLWVLSCLPNLMSISQTAWIKTTQKQFGPSELKWPLENTMADAWCRTSWDFFCGLLLSVKSLKLVLGTQFGKRKKKVPLEPNAKRLLFKRRSDVVSAEPSPRAD